MTITEDTTNVADDELTAFFGAAFDPTEDRATETLPPTNPAAEPPTTTGQSIPEALRGLRSRIPTRKTSGIRPRRHEAGRSDVEAAEFAARGNGTHTQVWTTYAARAAVLAALACGPIALVFGGGSSSIAPAPTAAPAATSDSAAKARAGVLARQLVIDWLNARQGDESKLKQLADSPDAMTLPTTPIFTATDPEVGPILPAAAPPSSAIQSTLPTYSVSVSASVHPAGDQNSPSTRRYFEVPVAVGPDAVRALTLPAEVAAPATNLNVDLGYQYQPALNHPVVTAARSFLSAMLTGSGDISRYTSPGTHLSAITPAPYKSVDVREALSSVDFSTTDASQAPDDGKKVRMLVTVLQKKDGDIDDGVTGTYALTLTARGGRWEVSALDAAPLASVAAPKPRPAADSSSTDDTSTGSSSTASTPAAASEPATETAADEPSTTAATQPEAAPTSSAGPQSPEPPATSAPAPTGPQSPAPTADPPKPLLAPGDSDLGPPQGR